MTLVAQSTLGWVFGTSIALPGFSTASITVHERSDVGCLLVNSAIDAADIISVLSDALNLPLPVKSGQITQSADCLALWLTPRSWLVQCPVDEEINLAKLISATFPDKIVHAAQFSDYLCWLELEGDGALPLIQEGGFVSLNRDGMGVGQAKRTLIAGVAAVIVRQAEARWLVGIERSRAAYFVEWLMSGADSSTTHSSSAI